MRKAHRTTPRPTTLERAKRYGENRAAQALRHAGLNTDAIAAYIQSAPSNQVGELRAYQDLVHYLVPPISAPLSLTMATARKLDELSAELRTSREGDALGPWKSTISSFIAREPMYCEHSLAPLPAHPLLAIERASDWEEVGIAALPVLWNSILDFLASLDLEYCSRAFGNQLCQRPLFLDLVPRLGSKWSNDENRGSQRGASEHVLRPSRRLIELGHAIQFRIGKGKWPAKPAGRSEIARLTDRGDQDVGNLFDGTTKLTFRSWDVLWREMSAALTGEAPSLSTPLLIAAQTWEHLFVSLRPDSREKSFIDWNGEDYLRWWNRRRIEWASALAWGESSWPGWLDHPSQ